jgi:hypothetical protein
MKKKCQLTYNEVSKILGDASRSADEAKDIEALKQLNVEIRTLTKKDANGAHFAYKYPIKSLISALDNKFQSSTFASSVVELKNIFSEVLRSGTRVEKKILETASVYSQNGLSVGFINQADSGKSDSSASYSSLKQTITLYKEHLVKSTIMHEYLHAVLDGVFLCHTLPYNDENERALYKTSLAKTFNNMNQFLKIINDNFNSCLKAKDIQIKPNYSSNIDDKKELSALLSSAATFVNKMTNDNNDIMYTCEYFDILDSIYKCAQGWSRVPAIEVEAITYLFSYLGFENPLANKLIEPLYDYYDKVVEPAFDAYIDHHKPAEDGL